MRRQGKFSAIVAVLFATMWIGAALAVPSSSYPPTQVVTTEGEKLRSAQQAASSGAGDYTNWAVNPPIFACNSGNNSLKSVVCSAWQASTAYAVGNVVVNNGHLWVATAAGTSASSGGPSTPTNAAVTDGTVTWFYDGEQPSATNDVNAPTITTTTTTPAFTGAVWYDAEHYQSSYTTHGADISIGAAYDIQKVFTMHRSSAYPFGYGAKICSLVTDVKFAVSNGLDVGGGAGDIEGITIDGRLLSVQADLYNSATPSWTILDYTSTTGFRTRDVCVLFTQVPGQPVFAGFATSASGSISPDPPSPCTMVWIGDSYDGGSPSGPWSAMSTTSQQVAAKLGCQVWPMGYSGTGPQNPGASVYNYQQRISDSYNNAIIATADLVYFNASTNDVGCSGPVSAPCPTGSETTAIQNVLSEIRAVNTKALIVVVGPASLPTQYAADVTLDSTAAAAVAAYSDPAGPNNLCYLPWANQSPFPSMFVASYQTGVPSGLPAIPFLVNTADEIHPYDLGTTQYAKWLASRIVSSCYSAMK